MCLDTWVKIFQIAAYIAAAVGILFTAFTYKNSNRIKHGEWLKDLFDKFYKEAHFAEIRKEIDFARIENFLGVNKNNEPTNESNEEAFVNYLNFFEFISTLIKREHLKKMRQKICLAIICSRLIKINL